MTTFSDLETSLANLTTAISTLSTAITNSQAGTITGTQADTIAAGINSATDALTSMATNLSTGG